MPREQQIQELKTPLCSPKKAYHKNINMKSKREHMSYRARPKSVWDKALYCPRSKEVANRLSRTYNTSQIQKSHNTGPTYSMNIRSNPPKKYICFLLCFSFSNKCFLLLFNLPSPPPYCAYTIIFIRYVIYLFEKLSPLDCHICTEDTIFK